MQGATKCHQLLCFDSQQLWQKDMAELLWGVSKNFTHLLSPHLPLAKFMGTWLHLGILKLKSARRTSLGMFGALRAL